MRTICSGTVGAPCGAVLRDEPAGPAGEVSHGLCDACAKVMARQIAEWRKARKLARSAA